jgi:hypothetical protein
MPSLCVWGGMLNNAFPLNGNGFATGGASSEEGSLQQHVVSSVDSNAGPYTSKRLWVIYRNTPRFIKEFDLRHRSGAQGGFIFKVT